MSKHYIELLKHILDECEYIQDVIASEINKSN